MKQERAINLAIENVWKEGLNDIFPRPFECECLENQYFRKSLNSILTKAFNTGGIKALEFGPIEHVIMPKKCALDFRRCALIQPIDTIKYLTLALLCVEAIEKERPNRSLNLVHSYRYKLSEDGKIFDPKYNFKSFTEHVKLNRNKERVRVIVHCDIANFYDRINLHRLECILHDLKIDQPIVRLIDELLKYWANRDSYSIPVGSNASRILAEAALIEVDKYLINAGVKFCRFVDDYRLFAPNAREAHYWLTQLVDRLWIEGLTLNKSKTKLEELKKNTSAQDSDSVEEDEADANTTSTVFEEEEEDNAPVVIRAGYGGDIPQVFIEASDKRKEKLKEIDIDKLLSKLHNSILPEAKPTKDFIGAILYQQHYTKFLQLPSVLERYPQFALYVVDMLAKKWSEIPSEVRMELSIKFKEQLQSELYHPEYVSIAIARLLGSEGYLCIDALMDLFRSLRRIEGGYIGRVLLESMHQHLSRGQVLEVRRYFKRGDPWEKRAIVRIVKDSLYRDEKRPWLENAGIQESRDPFLVELISPEAPK